MAGPNPAEGDLQGELRAGRGQEPRVLGIENDRDIVPVPVQIRAGRGYRYRQKSQIDGRQPVLLGPDLKHSGSRQSPLVQHQPVAGTNDRNRQVGSKPGGRRQQSR